MLYVPERNFLFIHIPRTAGNAITRTLASAIVEHQSIVFYSLQYGPLHRHSITRDVFDAYNLWDNQPEVWYVKRDEDEIINSDFKLWSAIPLDYEFKCRRNKMKRKAAYRGFTYFRSYWSMILRGLRIPTIEEFYTGPATYKHPIPYDNLEDYWPSLCEAVGCDGLPFPEKRDYELEYVKGLCHES